MNKHLDTFKNFTSIFENLVDYTNFMELLLKLPVQTPMMRQKQVLKVKNTYNEKLIKIQNQDSLSIHDWFEEDNAGHMCYPVKIVGLNVGWIFAEESGHKFLQAIFASQNMEFYSIETIQMIIEILYIKFKDSLYTKQMTLYAVQFIIFHCLFATAEIMNESKLVGYQ